MSGCDNRHIRQSARYKYFDKNRQTNPVDVIYY